jgi:hypothetical protein
MNCCGIEPSGTSSHNHDLSHQEKVMQAELPQGTRQTIQQQGGLSSDTRALMLFEANNKNAFVPLMRL